MPPSIFCSVPAGIASLAQAFAYCVLASCAMLNPYLQVSAPLSSSSLSSTMFYLFFIRLLSRCLHQRTSLLLIQKCYFLLELCSCFSFFSPRPPGIRHRQFIRLCFSRFTFII